MVSWGEKVSPSRINFEWPTQEVFEQMDPTVTLKSITFKDSPPAVSFVQCKYSNDQESPAFAKPNANQKNAGTVTFDDITKVRKVSAQCCNSPWNFVCKMGFFDKDGNEICKHLDYNYTEIV